MTARTPPLTSRAQPSGSQLRRGRPPLRYVVPDRAGEQSRIPQNHPRVQLAPLYRGDVHAVQHYPPRIDLVEPSSGSPSVLPRPGRAHNRHRLPPRERPPIKRLVRRIRERQHLNVSRPRQTRARQKGGLTNSSSSSNDANPSASPTPGLQHIRHGLPHSSAKCPVRSALRGHFPCCRPDWTRIFHEEKRAGRFDTLTTCPISTSFVFL